MSATGLRVLIGALLGLAIGAAFQTRARALRPAFPSLAGATEWLNSPPLTPAGLRGKVVLVDVWTFTCINWLRTLPYVRAWAAKYKEQGLVVIGVHTPEFSVEMDVEAVRRAAKEMGIDYAIAIDNDSAIWRALDNEYWPALYLFDAQGRLRHQHFGEGGYELSEQIIQRLLAEAGARGVDRRQATIEVRGIEAAADRDHLRSPETYVGDDRGERFSSPGGATRDAARAYQFPGNLALNEWALAGGWTVGGEFAVSSGPNGRIAYRFHARDLNLVMAPAGGAAAVRFRVLVDGEPPGAAHGLDVDDRGAGMVTGPRVYQLIRHSGPIVDRRFEIEFLDPGAQVFSFTFG